MGTDPRFPTSRTRPRRSDRNDPVSISPGCTWFDYELEIAAIIGRAGQDLDPDTADSHIAGYMIFCDWSARDLQMQEMKLSLGPSKGKDGANTFGPMLVTADELEPFRQKNSFHSRDDRVCQRRAHLARLDGPDGLVLGRDRVIRVARYDSATG